VKSDGSLSSADPPCGTKKKARGGWGGAPRRPPRPPTDGANPPPGPPARPPTATTPWGCTRLFELRHCTGDRVPAQVSRYAAPPIRSDILASDIGGSPEDRPSCELTRPVPSTLAADGPGKAACHTRLVLADSGRHRLGRRA